MPSFYDSREPRRRWQLTDYVYSLGDGDAPGYAYADRRGAARRGHRPRAAARRSSTGRPGPRFPLVGQVMEPGRDFAPSASSVEVRAVYDPQTIAFLVRWHDVRADIAGENSPDARGAARGGGAGRPPGRRRGRRATSGARRRHAARPQPRPPRRDGLLGRGAAPRAGAAPAAEFSDAVAIQLPGQLPAGATRGRTSSSATRQNSVDLWFLDLARKGVRQFVGRGARALAAARGERGRGRGSYAAGEWSAVFVRDLRSTGSVTLRRGPVRADRVLGLGRHRARAGQQARAHPVGLRLPAAAGEALGGRADAGRRRSASSRSSSWSWPGSAGEPGRATIPTRARQAEP